ncbi:unnamed protein product [Tenebrio molitor]|nr:unnamed protein product [Tenebrio molitor]
MEEMSDITNEHKRNRTNDSTNVKHLAGAGRGVEQTGPSVLDIIPATGGGQLH